MEWCGSWRIFRGTEHLFWRVLITSSNGLFLLFSLSLPIPHTKQLFPLFLSLQIRSRVRPGANFNNFVLKRIVKMMDFFVFSEL